jgi:hypothetical protein
MLRTFIPSLLTIMNKVTKPRRMKYVVHVAWMGNIEKPTKFWSKNSSEKVQVFFFYFYFAYYTHYG